MEIEEELDFEIEEEDYVNSLLYDTNVEESDKSLNHKPIDEFSDNNCSNHKSDQIIDQRLEDKNEDSIHAIDYRSDAENDFNIGSNKDKKQKKTKKNKKSLSEQNSFSEESKVKKKKKKRSEKHKKHRNKNSETLDQLKEQNSLKTKAINESYRELKPILNSYNERTVESQVLKSSNQLKIDEITLSSDDEIDETSSQYWDKYDTEGVTESCHVFLVKRSNNWIFRAINGKIQFKPHEDTEESEDSGDDHYNNKELISVKSPEFIFDDNEVEQQLDEIQNFETQKESENQMKNISKSIEPKVCKELKLSEESSSDDENGVKEKIITDFQPIIVKKNESKEDSKRISAKLIGLSSSGTDSGDDNQNIKSKPFEIKTKTNGKKSKSIKSSINEKQSLDRHKKSEGVHKIQNHKKKDKNDKHLKSKTNQNKKKSKQKVKDKPVVTPLDPIDYNYNGAQLSIEEFQRLIHNLPNNVTEVTEFQCEQCPFVTTEEMDLVFHCMEQHLNNSEVFHYSCPLCQDISFDEQSFNRHVQQFHPYQHFQQKYPNESSSNVQMEKTINCLNSYTFEDNNPNEMPSLTQCIAFHDNQCLPQLSQTNDYELKQIEKTSLPYNTTNKGIPINENEIQNAIVGLNQDQFVNNSNDMLSVALIISMNDEEEDEDSDDGLVF